MAAFRFTIPGRIPSLNTTLKLGRHNQYSQAFRRREIKGLIIGWVRAAQIPKFTGRVNIRVKWFEKDKRRDYDNISAGFKVIADALVITGRIQGDSQRWMGPPQHDFAIDKENPRIEVTVSDDDPATAAETQ